MSSVGPITEVTALVKMLGFCAGLAGVGLANRAQRFRGVLGVVAPDAEDILRGSRNRGQELDGGQGNSGVFRGQAGKLADTIERARASGDERQHVGQQGRRLTGFRRVERGGGPQQVYQFPIARDAQPRAARLIPECSNTHVRSPTILHDPHRWDRHARRMLTVALMQSLS